MILDYLASKTISSNDLVVVSPDVGGVARARAFAKKLSDAPLAIVDKRRHGHNVAEVITATKIHALYVAFLLEFPFMKDLPSKRIIIILIVCLSLVIYLSAVNYFGHGAI